MAGLAPSGPLMAVVNTDARALTDSTIARKIQIGQARTAGLGTGGDTEVGCLSASDDIEKIRTLFMDVDMVFLVVALGGGTGTGAAPVVMEAAREAGCMTLCFATLPFTFEGNTHRERAESAIPELRAAADAVITVSNDRLFESVSEATVTQAFVKADEVLGSGIRAIWKLLTNPGFINLDFADLTRIVKGSGGLCCLAYGNGSGKEKARKAVAELLKSPLTDHGQMLGRARAALVSIVGGPDLALKEIGDIMSSLTASLHADSHVAMGTVVDDARRNKVMVTLVFSEQWSSEGAVELPDKQVQTVRTPARKPARGKGRQKRKQRQARLSFESTAKGRFKDVEPTILDGEDLDIPTFIRRGIVIEK